MNRPMRVVSCPLLSDFSVSPARSSCVRNMVPFLLSPCLQPFLFPAGHSWRNANLGWQGIHLFNTLIAKEGAQVSSSAPAVSISFSFSVFINNRRHCGASHRSGGGTSNIESPCQAASEDLVELATAGHYLYLQVYGTAERALESQCILPLLVHVVRNGLNSVTRDRQTHACVSYTLHKQCCRERQTLMRTEQNILSSRSPF